MMRRHFRVPPANANTTATVTATANADADARQPQHQRQRQLRGIDTAAAADDATGSKSQQDTFDDYLYLTQLQQVRLRPRPTSPDLARPLDQTRCCKASF